MDKNQILQLILDSDKTIMAYYSYPTGTVWSTYLGESDVNDEENPITICVENLLNITTEFLGFRRDNKTAVKCTVEGFPNPIYFCHYDLKCIICTELNTNRGGSTYDVYIPLKFKA